MFTFVLNSQHDKTNKVMLLTDLRKQDQLQCSVHASVSIHTAIKISSKHDIISKDFWISRQTQR